MQVVVEAIGGVVLLTIFAYGLMQIIRELEKRGKKNVDVSRSRPEPIPPTDEGSGGTTH